MQILERKSQLFILDAGSTWRGSRRPDEIRLHGHRHVGFEGLWTDYEWRGLLPERRTGTGTCLPRCKRHETRDQIILSILGARLFHVAWATDKQNSAKAVDDRPRIYADTFQDSRGVRLAKWHAHRHSWINVWMITRLSRELAYLIVVHVLLCWSVKWVVSSSVI